MNPVIIVSAAAVLILVLLLTGVSMKPVRWTGRLIIRILGGAFILFIINVVGSQHNFHIPINVTTTVTAGVLGIPGIAAMGVIKYFIMP